jgi:hypothetical protein
MCISWTNEEFDIINSRCNYENYEDSNILFTLLATSFRHQTIIRPSLHKIYNRLHVVLHIKCNVIWDPIKLTS